MKKIIKNMGLAGGALLSLFLVGVMLHGIVGAAYNDGTATGYTNIRVNNIKILDTGIYDSAGTLRWTPGASNDFIGAGTFTTTLGVTGLSTLTGGATVKAAFISQLTSNLSTTTLQGTTTVNDAINLNGAVASSTITLSGLVYLYATAAPLSITPARAGALVWNTTDNEVCVSTGTGKGAFSLVTATTTACHH
jgi:hypothetical protein